VIVTNTKMLKNPSSDKQNNKFYCQSLAHQNLVPEYLQFGRNAENIIMHSAYTVHLQF